jgi:predicted MFS family arabinose efflux permease
MRSPRRWSPALTFVVLVGVISLFADWVYEGARSVLGPYLALLGAGAFTVGAVSGFGELVGYGLRLVSGQVADRTRWFWGMTIAGYAVQLVAVPALALAGSWQAAAVLIVMERAGKAIRNPPRNVMLSHAGRELGLGWAFGLHEALDQLGALIGPLMIAGILAYTTAGLRFAFAVLAIPAAIAVVLVIVARLVYPRPQDLETKAPLHVGGSGLPRVYWIYLAGACLVAAGFADFPLVAFHFQRAGVVGGSAIPIFYAVAMATGGAASLVFGRLFDRFGIAVLVPLTVATALFAPLVFLGGFWLALIGSALWGVGMGVHESVMSAAIVPMVGSQRRASAYGTFTAAYGVSWFLGSALLGALYGVAPAALVIASVALELTAVPVLLAVARRRSGDGRL